MPGGALRLYPGQAPRIHQRIQPQAVHQRNITGGEQTGVRGFVTRLVQGRLEQDAWTA